MGKNIYTILISITALIGFIIFSIGGGELLNLIYDWIISGTPDCGPKTPDPSIRCYTNWRTDLADALARITIGLPIFIIGYRKAKNLIK